MTQHPDTPGHGELVDPDELANAYLDGETTPAQSARVESDVDLLRRVETLARVRDLMAVEPQPSGVADAQVEAALAAFDQLDTAGQGATVTDLADRRRWYERVPLGAVAAAVAVVALAAGLVAGFDLTSGNERDDIASQDFSADDDDSSTEDGASAQLESGGSAAADGALAPESAPLSDSGFARIQFADVDALAVHLRDRLSNGASPAAGGGGGSGPSGGSDQSSATTQAEPAPDEAEAARAFDPCDAVAVAGVDPNFVRLIDSVVLRGVDVTAVVHFEDNADQLVVVADGSCEVIERRPL